MSWRRGSIRSTCRDGPSFLKVYWPVSMWRRVGRRPPRTLFRSGSVVLSLAWPPMGFRSTSTGCRMSMACWGSLQVPSCHRSGSSLGPSSCKGSVSSQPLTLSVTCWSPRLGSIGSRWHGSICSRIGRDGPQPLPMRIGSYAEPGTWLRTRKATIGRVSPSVGAAVRGLVGGSTTRRPRSPGRPGQFCVHGGAE